ncbi:hypothetical protein VV02_19305 [Luteipulveratus mongoliensis]|uniref:Uncharacterized protein n=2 Tax=Luteipulveratus mongoliensis TaxID=571913 RepID=A0A0K1JLM9_9MICO|nr:hypothetical protein VV02_19305 [Luteipulveratus mongoliensis]
MNRKTWPQRVGEGAVLVIGVIALTVPAKLTPAPNWLALLLPSVLVAPIAWYTARVAMAEAAAESAVVRGEF